MFSLFLPECILSLSLLEVGLGITTLLDILDGDTLNGLEDTCGTLSLLLRSSLDLSLLVLSAPRLSPGQTLSLDLLNVQRTRLLIDESKKLNTKNDRYIDGEKRMNIVATKRWEAEERGGAANIRCDDGMLAIARAEGRKWKKEKRPIEDAK